MFTYPIVVLTVGFGQSDPYRPQVKRQTSIDPSSPLFSFSVDGTFLKIHVLLIHLYDLLKKN